MMNEYTTHMTETEQETVTTSTEITSEETQTQSQEMNPSYSDPVEALPDNSENILHQLFAEIGVNLDYTPTNTYQCFTMSFQFIAALWFIWWFVKYLFTLMRSFLSKRW